MKENFYTFFTNVIISNINKLDIDDSQKEKLLIDVIKKLEAK